ncbi:hypothetical protein CR513_31454, partial [Mucuna pruriens]
MDWAKEKIHNAFNGVNKSLCLKNIYLYRISLMKHETNKSIGHCMLSYRCEQSITLSAFEMPRNNLGKLVYNVDDNWITWIFQIKKTNQDGEDANGDGSVTSLMIWRFLVLMMTFTEMERGHG